jgi:hypothetical protein
MVTSFGVLVLEVCVVLTSWLAAVIRYIHRNPVKRGLVASPGDYQWSGFGHYATGVRGAVEIESV